MLREEQAEDCQTTTGNAAEVEDRSRKLEKGLDIFRGPASQAWNRRSSLTQN